MKTILFISPTGTFDNGAEISIYHLMVHLKNSGYKIINVAPKAVARDQSDYLEIFRKENIDVHFISAVQWWWDDSPLGAEGFPGQRAASYRESIKSITEIIKVNQVDLVITNTVNMFQGMIAAACTEVPHFLLIHEFPDGEFAYYRDKIDFLEDNSDRLFSVAGELNNALEKIFTKTKIGRFSPYTKTTQTMLKVGEKQRIVSVGRLTERKNQLELIKAFNLLTSKSEYDQLELIFIGPWDAGYKQKCDEYIRKHNVKHVSFSGHLDNPWSAVTDKDICVFPSSLETYGLVYVESLLNGVPTILSDNPGHLSAYQNFEFGTLYPLGDINKLVFEIEKVIQNFESEKSKAIVFIPLAKKKFRVASVYSEIITAIEGEIPNRLKSLRHLRGVLTENEPKSKLARFETKFRILLQKVKRKLLR